MLHGTLVIEGTFIHPLVVLFGEIVKPLCPGKHIGEVSVLMAEFEGTKARPPGIRAKWFVADETIGIGKIRLLETVGELGSISAAARQMGMGYKRAWFLIASLQQGFNAPLIETVRGGNTHGGAAITELGKELVRRFNAHEVEIQTGFASLSEWLQTVQARAPVSGAPVTDAQVCESDANEAGVDEAGTEQQGGSDDAVKIGWKR
ncbi:MAG: LysR family transcriptional regulator [SAR116 cluster bacterium]|nr:MAG: LysR family transcriptional regulator [SAR116 cluster bacterium]